MEQAGQVAPPLKALADPVRCGAFALPIGGSPLMTGRSARAVKVGRAALAARAGISGQATAGTVMVVVNSIDRQATGSGDGRQAWCQAPDAIG